MLEDKSLKEQSYQTFLSTHPAIFLAPYDCYLVISKLKLGSEYETDFVVVTEGYSNGTNYSIIEIESPHTKLFTSSGVPTSKFNSALQQIRDWKRYLQDNRTFTKNYLPSTSTRLIRDSKINFKIIIGRRDENIQHLEKRRQIMDTDQIEIISFDRLTEIAKSRIMFFDESSISSGQMHFTPSIKKNQLANPFYIATNDSTWKTICKNGGTHFYSGALDNIIATRHYNDYLKKFIKYVDDNEII